jgi:uncharacterized membrane protein YeaQ/YmgE (transglycosylase-associated protein family)
MIFAVFAVLLVLFVVLPLIGFAVWFLVTTALVGIVLGALGRLVVPGQQPIGVLATIVCGWGGSLIGGAIGRLAFGYHHHRFATFLIEVAVSAIGVAAWSAHDRKAVAGRQQHRVIDV